MKREQFNRMVVSQFHNEYREFNRVIFLDVETTPSIKITKYGTEWYNKILTFQLGIYSYGEFKKVLSDNPQELLDFIQTLGFADLVIGFNLLFDIGTIYRNLYMIDTTREYNAIPPFTFHILDLMLSYDLSIGLVLGKKEDKDEKGKERMLVSIKKIPNVPIGDKTILDLLSEEIQTEMQEAVNPYATISTKIEDLGNGFSNINVRCSVCKKLKYIMGILGEKTSLIEDLHWAIPDTDENNFICSRDRIEEFREAERNNREIISDPKSNFWIYAEHDIDFLIHLLYALGYPQTSYFHEEVLSQAYLNFIGIELRQSLIEKETEKLKQEKHDISEKINSFMGRETNLNSVNDKKELLQKLTGKTPKNTTKDTIAEIAEQSSNPLLKRLAHMGHISYMLRLFETLKECRGGTLHPTNLLSSTLTFRNRSTGFQMLCIPRDNAIRSVFIIGGCGDQSSAEVSGLAITMKDEVLLQDLKDKIDPHCRILSLISDTPYEEVFQKYKEGDAETVEARRTVKSVTFAAFYGGTIEGIAKKANIEPEKAKKVLDTFSTRYRQFSLYREMTSEFRNFDQIVKDWDSIDKFLDMLPVCVSNIFGLRAFAAIEKALQKVLEHVGSKHYDELKTRYPEAAYVRNKETMQTLSGCIRSSCLGAISKIQGDIQRRLMNFTIQSLVSCVTKIGKMFLYRQCEVCCQDIHDEILLFGKPENIKRAISVFHTFIEEIRKDVPTIDWKITETNIWKK